jgi:hypothetical protein
MHMPLGARVESAVFAPTPEKFHWESTAPTRCPRLSISASQESRRHRKRPPRGSWIGSLSTRREGADRWKITETAAMNVSRPALNSPPCDHVFERSASRSRRIAIAKA